MVRGFVFLFLVEFREELEVLGSKLIDEFQKLPEAKFLILLIIILV